MEKKIMSELKLICTERTYSIPVEKFKEKLGIPDSEILFKIKIFDGKVRIIIHETN